MGSGRGYRSEPFGGDRWMVAAASSVNREKNTIHLTTEADITEPRRMIAAHRARTGERLSLTGYVVACLAQTFEEFPRFNSYRVRGRLIVFDELVVSVLFEREVDGASVPEPVPVRDACRKTYRQVNDEIRAAQASEGGSPRSASGMGWIRFVPAPLLRTFIRLAARSIRMQQRYGVVGVTAVGMFGAGPLWLIPLTNATVTVAVGSIATRVAIVDGVAENREHLCLTLSFDHDIIDGAPAARFTSRFVEHLASGEHVRAAAVEGG
ncbi:MAG: 2-oxo acid dehydrogenase subunit E2 [Anaerosomatales bacterium]|nr:2-oxo acid dehydrogenase subunit E2 [Anaerosomatales bacterium]